MSVSGVRAVEFGPYQRRPPHGIGAIWKQIVVVADADYISVRYLGPLTTDTETNATVGSTQTASRDSLVVIFDRPSLALVFVRPVAE